MCESKPKLYFVFLCNHLYLHPYLYSSVFNCICLRICICIFTGDRSQAPTNGIEAYVTEVYTEIIFLTQPFTFIKFVFVSLLYLYLDLYYAWAHSMWRRPMAGQDCDGHVSTWRKRTRTNHQRRKRRDQTEKSSQTFLFQHIFRLMLFFHILQESNARIRGGLHSVYITILEKVQGWMLKLLTSFLTWNVIMKS